MIASEGQPPEQRKPAPLTVLIDALVRIDKGIPKEVDVWKLDDKSAKRQKAFEPQVTILNIQEIAQDFGTDETDTQAIVTQFSEFYRFTADNFDFVDRPRDTFQHEQLDNFISRFPSQIKSSLGGKNNASILLHNLLSIGIDELKRISAHVQSSRFSDANYEITETGRSLERLAEYLKGGDFNETIVKQNFLAGIIDRSQNGKVEKGGISSLSELALAAKNEACSFGLEHQALDNLNDFILTVFDADSSLLGHLKPESIQQLTIATRGIANSDEKKKLTLIREAGQIAAALREKDTYATHIFCQVVFDGLANAVQNQNYGFDEAKSFLESGANFLHFANGNKTQDKEAYEQMRQFLGGGYLAILLSVKQPEFTTRVIQAIEGEGHATRRIAKAMNALDFMAADTYANKLSGHSLDATRQIDFYLQVAMFDKFPDYRAATVMRESLERISTQKTGITEGEPDMRKPLLSLMGYGQEISQKDMEVLSFGLATAFANEGLSRLTLTDAASSGDNEFVNYILGLGVLRKSWRERRFWGKQQVSDFLEVPNRPEGRSTLIQAMGKLANLYLSTINEAERVQIHHLATYAMEHNELRIPFLMHLYSGATAETLKKLSWITRLAESDATLALSINKFLGQRMNEFVLPQSASDDGRPLALVTYITQKEVALDQIVDNSQPLGAAIKIIGEAVDHDPQIMHSTAEALGKVELKTVKDAETLTGPIIGAIAKFLKVDLKALQENMFTFRKASDLVDQIYEAHPIAGTVAMVHSIIGGGIVPLLAYRGDTNEIIINEQQHGGWKADELGEEIAHWVRETIAPSSEVHNPIVDEFWGFLGRRIARTALGIEDVKVTAKDFEKAIERSLEEILEWEHYGYLDTGFAHRLKGLIEHIVGYVAASNVDIRRLPEGLIQSNDEAILEEYIQKYGPDKKWFIQLIDKAQKAHNEAKGQKLITDKVTPIDSVLEPILQALDYLPFIREQGKAKNARRKLTGTKPQGMLPPGNPFGL